MQVYIACIQYVTDLESEFLNRKMRRFLIKNSGDIRNRGAKTEEQARLRLKQETRFKGATMFMYNKSSYCTISVQFSCSVVSNSWPQESQHARPPCSSPTPRVHLNSCPSSHWCHPAISSSVVTFSFCPQSLPASGSFPKSQLLALWIYAILSVSYCSINLEK